MSKNALPSIEQAKPNGVSRPAIAKPEPPEPNRCEQAMGYVPRRVEARLTREQAVKLRDKLRLLQDTGAKTADGRFVANRAQAMQWIIENEVTV